ncbi:MAG: ABC transporter permease [Selenomonadaceae bacterium]|nr:ABC transporter permease [Selenomonadaceae bacterium]MBQ3725858.1 ABC transporter permease [Selenomonadaceae bacterium]MBQ9497162.1 ABC transporter permease [Selenomonadaceae bacterium]
MLFTELLKMAWRSLGANKLRTFLTMLGVIIGVTSVIALVSVGMGVKKNILDNISRLGSNMLIVMPGSANRGGMRGAAGSVITLTYDDAEAIKKKIKNVEYVSPTVQGSYQVVYGHENWNTTVTGVVPEYVAIQSLELKSGLFFSAHDVDVRNRVAVIGPTVAANLFESVNPVGKKIRIGNAPYTIIGVLESKGQSSGGQDQDDTVLIPLTTAQERLVGVTYVRSINVQVSDADKMDEVQSNIEKLLRQRHRIRAGAEDDFNVRNLTSLMEMMNSSATMITLLLGAIAGISLIVGGVGIMNITLASVTERTREIGIRKAIGATYSNIMLQFLIESTMISVIGGIIGIGVGVVAAQAISKFGGFTTVISSLSIAASFGFALFVGIFFGLLPARKAARLDPIEALRYE